MEKQLKLIVAEIADHAAIDGYSEAKELIASVKNALESGDRDFEITTGGNDYRIIREDEIDQIMGDELASDPYVLGCCSDWLLSDVTGIPIDAVRKIQKAEAFEALGIIIANNDQMLSEVVRIISSHDSYGPHFAYYDGEERSAGEYYIFRTN